MTTETNDPPFAETIRDRLVEQLTAVNEQLEQFASVASNDLREPLRIIVCFTDLLEKEYGGQLDDEGKRYMAITRQAAKKMEATVSDLLAYGRLGQNLERLVETDCNDILKQVVETLDDTNLDKTQREYVDTMNHSAQNLLLLINDVLDLSKIEAGELILEKRPFDIKNGFTQTINLLKPLARKKGNALLHHIDGSIPDIIVGDQGRFAQIVTNLVGNAVKFTENGKVETSLSYDAASTMIHCAVKDTGIGIPPSKYNSIFEKFTQGDASITRKYGGTGLGLAITKNLVVMLGGEIGFESKEKSGSRFWFTLPVSLTKTDPLQDPHRIMTAQTLGQTAVGDARVLIADDHPVNQLFLGALLKKFGFSTIDLANNGLAVLDAIKRVDDRGNPIAYNAIFMDCKMPEMDGYETTRLIRDLEIQLKSPQRTPIIAMTANALSGDRETCFEAGMDDYITKPLHPDRLKDTLKRWFIFPDSGTDGQRHVKTPANTTPPLDFSRLQMVAETDADKSEILALFFRLAQQSVVSMESARRRDETMIWKNAAHSLKGAAANLGMSALEKTCFHAEISTAIDYGQRTSILQQINEELENIKAYIVEQKPSLLTNGK